MFNLLRKSRAILVSLIVLLMLAPMSVLANADEEKEINYVALGDSLAAGVLSNNTIGTGYVHYIADDLNSRGYVVNLSNKGVPGATSGDLLAGLASMEDELAGADVITISVGANDVLGKLDKEMIGKINPNYLDSDYREHLHQVALEAEEAANAAYNAMLFEVEPTKTVVNFVKINTNSLKVEIENSIDAIISQVPDEYKMSVEQVRQDIGLAADNATAADSTLAEAMKTEDTVKFATVIEGLETTAEKLTSVSSILDQALIILPDELKPGISDLINRVNAVKTQTNSAIASVESLAGKAVVYASALDTAEKAAIEANTAEAIARAVSQMENEIKVAIGNVGTNMAAILGKIKQINPEAKVYVMGYYNALPYLPEDLQKALTQKVLTGLNNAIEGAVNISGATFIPTDSLIVKDYRTYLPNPENIHPSDAGYRVIATAFMKQIGNVYPVIAPETPDEKTIKLGEKTEVSPGQLIMIDGTKTKLVLPDDLPVGTTLTVTKTSDDALAKAKGLRAVGDVLHFEFNFPDGSDYAGTFNLVMGYDADSTENLDIYYFNEEKGMWENQFGKINGTDKEVSVAVTHFSNYGVFVAKDDNKSEDPPEDDDGDKNDDDGKKDDGDNTGTDGKDNDGTTPGKKDNGEKNGSKKSDGDKKLPDTATNMYNWILAGSIMLVLGTGTLIFYNRRKPVGN